MEKSVKRRIGPRITGLAEARMMQIGRSETLFTANKKAAKWIAAFKKSVNFKLDYLE